MSSIEDFQSKLHRFTNLRVVEGLFELSQKFGEDNEYLPLEITEVNILLTGLKAYLIDIHPGIKDRTQPDRGPAAKLHMQTLRDYLGILFTDEELVEDIIVNLSERGFIYEILPTIPGQATLRINEDIFRDF